MREGQELVDSRVLGPVELVRVVVLKTGGEAPDFHGVGVVSVPFLGLRTREAMRRTWRKASAWAWRAGESSWGSSNIAWGPPFCLRTVEMLHVVTVKACEPLRGQQ